MSLRLLLICLLVPSTTAAAADQFLVKDGQAQAEIIIAENPTRTQHLAAVELQTYVEKISGARLTLGHKPGDAAVKVFVGQSSHTEKLGVTSKGLEHGAYRIVSGEGWIALIGDDSDFTPIEPWPRGYADIRDGRMQKAWDEITGARWGYTHSQLHKHYSGPNSVFGTPDEQKVSDEGHVHVWTYDERGSFNAVCAFLRDLGVRWYMPGEVGEVLPKMNSIAVPQIDRTVRPDFPMRILNFRAAVYGHDVMMWGFRLGVRQPFGRQAAHGLHTMTDNERTLKNHPDWFALYGGRRHNQLNVKNNQLCYSNDELLSEAVRFARVQFDHYDMDVVSIMPPDGYTSICQCELCEGKGSPELGYRGSLSNYVWDFVNRVAREVGKSHPGKKISNCAYGIYTEPPSNIEKLEPNVQVIIVGGRRPLSEDRDDLRRLRSEWQKKTDNPIEIFENYPFTGRGFYLPAYMPRLLGESINETKGQSRGEDIWLTMDFKENAIGYNHFLAYFTARMYWGGKDQDAGTLFDEYVEKFYGPIADEMGAFFSYCEQNWREMEKDGEKASHALALFALAKEEVHEGSIYAARVHLIDNYLNGLRNKAIQLAQKRGPVPSLRLVSGATQRGKIEIDGRLDDGPWTSIPVASTGRLRELQTGKIPTYGTRFMTEWIGNDLYFAIRCDEQPQEQLNVTATKDGDQAIWYGDVVELEIATEAHSYYQLAISPSGALVDLDRGAPRNQWFNWSSKAEVATQIADDHWTVEVRIPVTQDANDPLHQVVGHKPTQSLPWFVNVCRQRVRKNGTELSAYSPSGSGGFHVPMKFAHFHAGNSHRFPADSTVTDYVIAGRAAEGLARTRKWGEALEAYLKLANAKKVTEFQKADALQRAARCACGLKEFERADEIAGQIPIDAVAKTTRMQNLSAQRKWSEIVREFEGEDLSKWPFWQIGEGAFARGRAYYITKSGEQADRDLRTALAYTPDSRIQLTIRTTMAHNLEANLDNEAEALELYLLNVKGKQGIGGADEFRSVERAASILARQGKHVEALAVFDVVDFKKVKGYWRGAMLLALGNTHVSAGRKSEALEVFNELLNDQSPLKSHRDAAKEQISTLKEK